ncbi:MAG TPA: hypothetical protein VGV35_13635 [Bryobacteraceae bacterium]|nr:hypothetical protein [Bryobacteraceae bacterium]
MRQDYNAAFYRIQPSKDEYKNFKAMRGYDVSAQFRVGQATFPVISPGTYYLWKATRLDNRTMTWQIKLEVKPGSEPDRARSEQRVNGEVSRRILRT